MLRKIHLSFRERMGISVNNFHNSLNGTIKKVPMVQPSANSCMHRDSNPGVACDKQVPRHLAHQSLHGVPGIGHGYKVISEVYIQILVFPTQYGRPSNRKRIVDASSETQTFATS